jgi:hypothetical protein
MELPSFLKNLYWLRQDMKDYLEKDLFLWKILCYTIGGNIAPGLKGR